MCYKLLVLSIMMKSKVLFSVIASASLFPFLLSSPAQSWDPEEELRQQNQQRTQKHRLCDLAENNPTHLKYEKMLNKLERKARVNGNQATTVFVFTGPSAPFHQGCDVVTLEKEEFIDGCKNLYKIIGGDLVHFRKCPGRNTLKHVYVKVDSKSSSLSPHSLDLADCNEMENLKMKCKGDDGKIYQSRISYCKSDPIQPGCEFILSGNY